jgi:acetate kinase
MKQVLVVNSGSSSVKFKLIDLDSRMAIKSGNIERVTDHSIAFAQMLDELGAATPIAVGHRVVHGGSQFSKPTLIDSAVLYAIDELSALAPLHNPGNAAGIRAAMKAFGELPHVAVFDTAFHQTMPASSYRYAIDRELEEKFQIRRYGFHGSSYSYVSREAANLLGVAIENLNAIILHLGSGASACAVKAGKSFDTSMGFTPLQGLVMGSRTGDIDAAIFGYLERVANMSLEEVDESFNKNGGLKGMTGEADLRDVERNAESGDLNAQEAIAVYVQRIKHYVGAYLAELGRVDALVFTAGVGENSDVIRAAVLDGLNVLGFELDAKLNVERSKLSRDISTSSSKVRILVIPTDEEFEIAVQAASFA